MGTVRNWRIYNVCAFDWESKLGQSAGRNVGITVKVMKRGENSEGHDTVTPCINRPENENIHVEQENCFLICHPIHKGGGGGELKRDGLYCWVQENV